MEQQVGEQIGKPVGPGLVVTLRDIDTLVGHEETIDERLATRVDKMERRGFYKPIIVDDASGTILDGHHKTAAARRLGLRRVPVLAVDYLADERIAVDVWPGCGRDRVAKVDVLDMAAAGGLFPPKTSRHVFTFDLPVIAVELEALR
jgi:hypothetical protein